MTSTKLGQRYRCTKEVYAWKIGEVTGRTIRPEDPTQPARNMLQGWIDLYNPRPGQYFVTDQYGNSFVEDALEFAHTHVLLKDTE